MEQLWDDFERLLHSQQRVGKTIDSVVVVGTGKQDKIIVKGRAGAFKIVPRGVAQRAGVIESAGHATIRDAVAAAHAGAVACGLQAIKVRFGHGKNPATHTGRALSPLSPSPVAPMPKVLPSPAGPNATASGPTSGSPCAFVDFARGQLRDLLDVSGQVLYSGASTLRKGEVYLLGLNPGGDPNNPALMTIRQSLDGLVSDDLTASGVLKSEWNSYVHATWKGRDTLQRRILWLLAQLGLDPLGVAASNLIFPRSRNEKSLLYQRYATMCWSVHERALEIVQPRWVLTYGSTPYRYLGERFGVRNERRFPSGHGNWECRSFEVPGRFRVVGVPHLSLYAIDGHPEVVEWITRL